LLILFLTQTEPDGFRQLNFEKMKTLYYFKKCTSIFEVKKKYKELAFIHHPDKGGNTKIMQDINNEYEYVIKNNIFPENPEPTPEETERNIKFPEIISELVKYDNIIIELIGKWTWVSGNTFAIKEDLKKLGFLFSGNKKMWYFRSDEEKRSNHNPKDIEEIRNKYGSDIYKIKKSFLLS
jgi:hypothetical protein